MSNTFEEKQISDPYFMAYHILSTALRSKNMNEDIPKTLYMAKLFFHADDIVLYKQNESGDYVHKYNSALMNFNPSLITAVLNSAKSMVEMKDVYELNLSLNDFNKLAFIRINVDNNNYVVALSGKQDFSNLKQEFINIYRDSMRELLSKLELFNTLSKSSEVDALTGLSNRNKYEKDIKEIPICDGLIYALFDLFRLKNINDNYSHEKGDEYIKKAADILKKHFPRYIYTRDATGKRVKAESGTCLYRVGGDEFVLISDTESYESAQIKMMIIQDEAKNIDLGINEKIGINYGLTEAKNNETFRDLYLKSDALLSNNKKEYYQSLDLDRRK